MATAVRKHNAMAVAVDYKAIFSLTFFMFLIKSLI